MVAAVENQMTIEELLNTVIWYNGLYEIVRSWKDLPVRGTAPYVSIFNDRFYGASGYDPETKAQLEIIWMIAVLKFGEYGTSPRSGWIEKVDEFKKWIDEITKVDEEDE